MVAPVSNATLSSRTNPDEAARGERRSRILQRKQARRCTRARRGQGARLAATLFVALVLLDGSNARLAPSPVPARPAATSEDHGAPEPEADFSLVYIPDFGAGKQAVQEAAERLKAGFLSLVGGVQRDLGPATYIPDFRPAPPALTASLAANATTESGPMDDAENLVSGLPIPPQPGGPTARLMPDSEVVYGPRYADYDLAATASRYQGYLSLYQERVEGALLSGPQILQLVAERYSVGPRVLLALLELQGGWLSRRQVAPTQASYPFGLADPVRTGLFKQASWAADQINEGYYASYYGDAITLAFRDGRQQAVAPGLNPGTVAIQFMLARTTSSENWQRLIAAEGFRATYVRLFGDPASRAVEPLLPADLEAPALRLPWADDKLWFYTGGPHGGWGSGSSWAAVDFAPQGASGSCAPSADWETAVAPGRVVRVETGRVMVNLEGGDFQGRGWTVMYMHVGAAGRVAPGTLLELGDRIGHASCEGGTSTASHLHFARLFNGQWIAANDRRWPLVLSGWAVQGTGKEYNGYLQRDGVTLPAVDGQVLNRNSVKGEPVP